jgi:outer membrane protein TolC
MYSPRQGLALAILVVTSCVWTRAQPPSASTAGPSTAAPVQLSNRGAQAQGSVVVNQSTTNAGGGNSVNLIQSSVGVQGQFQGSTASGKDTGAILSLTLEKALALGLRFNLSAIGQLQSVRQAEGQRVVARSTLLPNVTTVINETVEQLNLRTAGVLEPSFPLAVGPFNFFDARAARVNQSVFDLVRLRNFQSAAQNVKSASEAARDSRDLIVLAVGGSYLQIIATNARIAAARAQVDSSDAVYRQATDRLEAGLNARIDATRSEVQLDTDRQRLRSLQADAERQKLDLARLIGLPRGQRFEIADDFSFAPLTEWTLEQALIVADRDRADLRAAAAGVKAAEAALKAAHAERLPNLTLTADYGAAGLRPDFEAHGVFTVSGTLAIPLYEGGRVRGDVEQADAAVQGRRAELEDMRGRIDQDVRRSYIDLSAAEDQVAVARRNVDLAQDTLIQARDRFTAGIADTIEVVQAQQTVVQAANDYISGVFEHNLAKVSLARAIGNAEQHIMQFLRK